MAVYEENLIEVCSLTPAQQKAFASLKRAYTKCLNLNIHFENNYGLLEAFDGDKVVRYLHDYEKGENRIVHEAYPVDYLKTLDSWADDTHALELTEKGMKIYNKSE